MYIELLAKAITLDDVNKKLRRDFILCFEYYEQVLAKQNGRLLRLIHPSTSGRTAGVE